MSAASSTVSLNAQQTNFECRNGASSLKFRSTRCVEYTYSVQAKCQSAIRSYHTSSPLLFLIMNNESQLILYTSVGKFPSEADGLSASEWLESVKACMRKACITGESRVWFTSNRLDEDFSHVIERRLLRPLVREQREKCRTFTWNFTKLCIAILKIEERAKVQRATHTASNTPASSRMSSGNALEKTIEYAARDSVNTAVSHVNKVNNLRSAGFGANGIIKGSNAAITHSRIGMATKGSEFAAKQSLGMKNLASTTFKAVGPMGIASIAIGAAYAGYKLYRYATEEDSQPQVPVVEYVWDYSRITEEDLNLLARDLLEDG
ncbi:hypothetical protein B0H19DRAFT_1148941 [Mycena capillaripes]|nr:hypothetical protein B0H19DRAFT_1148941 [Mycena capillaripes]